MINYDINKIVDLFKDISTNHPQIASYDYGFEFGITTQKQDNQLYPQLFVQPLSTQIKYNNSNTIKDRRFRIWCYDIEKRDDRNKISIWNDTEWILDDVLRLVNKDYVKITNQPILFPFQERFGEDLTGYYAEVVITTYDIVGNCQIPTK